MRRVFLLLVVIAAFFAGGYVFAIRGEHQSTDTTTTSSPSTVPSTSTSTSTTSTEKVAPPCASDLLTAALTPTGGGLGSATFQLRVQNTGAEACTVRGYLALQLRDAAQGALPTNVIPTTSGFKDASANHAPSLVTLAVGATALSDGVYPTVPAGSERTCAIASSMSLTVPQTTTPLSVTTTISPCARGLIRLSPLFGA